MARQYFQSAVVVNAGHAYYLSNLQCGRVGVTRVGSTPKLPVRGSRVCTVLIEVRVHRCRMYVDYGFTDKIRHSRTRLDGGPSHPLG